MKDLMKKCKCGCGEFVRPDRTYINGHNSRGISVSHNEKTKKIISIKAKERFKNGQIVNCKIYDIPSKEDLEYMYNEKFLSMNQLSKMMDTSIPTLKKWMLSYEMKIRNLKKANQNALKTGSRISSYNDPVVQRKCFDNRKVIRQSKQELEVYEYIKTFYDKEIYQSYKLEGAEIDIFIPDKNIGIEYNGLAFHSEMLHYVFKTKSLKQVKTLHQYKTNIARKNNIHLIHIWEDDWNNKQDIIKRKISYLLNGPEKRIYARKCSITKLSGGEAEILYSKYHIQGGVNATVHYGLMYGNELVSCMSFTHKKDDWELVRFACSCSVVGGFSKLVKHFIKYNQIKGELYSFADLTIVNPHNNVYLNNGWLEAGYLQPDYKYIVDGERKHKFGFRHSCLKNKLENYDPSLTEHENCLNNKIYCIWDAGKIKYTYCK